MAHVSPPDVQAGALVRAVHCIIERIGRSGCEAESGGVIELQDSVVQVRCCCFLLLLPLAFAACASRCNWREIARSKMLQLTVEGQECEQHCVAAGRGGRIGCHGCRWHINLAHAPPDAVACLSRALSIWPLICEC